LAEGSKAAIAIQLRFVGNARYVVALT